MLSYHILQMYSWVPNWWRGLIRTGVKIWHLFLETFWNPVCREAKVCLKWLSWTAMHKTKYKS